MIKKAEKEKRVRMGITLYISSRQHLKQNNYTSNGMVKKCNQRTQNASKHSGLSGRKVIELTASNGLHERTVFGSAHYMIPQGLKHTFKHHHHHHQSSMSDMSVDTQVCGLPCSWLRSSGRGWEKRQRACVNHAKHAATGESPEPLRDRVGDSWGTGWHSQHSSSETKGGGGGGAVFSLRTEDPGGNVCVCEVKGQMAERDITAKGTPSDYDTKSYYVLHTQTLVSPSAVNKMVLVSAC